jgi:hypothetical protein
MGPDLMLCTTCGSRFLHVSDDPGTGKPRCLCSYHPPAGDLVWRTPDGGEHRMRSGPVTPPPGMQAPFVLTWVGTRCGMCGLWRPALPRDDATNKLVWAPETPPSMAPSELCVCP